MSEELFDIVDENNNHTGQAVTRKEVHEKGIWHRVVHVYFFREHENSIEFLVHLRSKHKDRVPNMWDTRFGGHIKSDENIEGTVVGEMADEVGLNVKFSDLLVGEISKREDFPDNEFRYTFYYRFSGDLSELHFSDGEVQAVRWMSIAQIKASMKKEPEQWAAGLEGFKKVSSFLLQNFTIK